MDITEWMAEDEKDILCHIEDSLRSGEFSEMINQQTAVKYIRFNMSRLNSPTWAHIASGKPFVIMPGRFGRYSTTICGKEYESDDFSTVKDEHEAVTHLCKKCAKLAGIEHQRGVCLSDAQKIYVHATDGRGLYAGMKNIMATSTDEAIAIAKATWRDVPSGCTQWFATTDKQYVKSAGKHK